MDDSKKNKSSNESLSQTDKVEIKKKSLSGLDELKPNTVDESEAESDSSGE